MAILEKEIAQGPDLQRHRFTREEYYKLADAGLLDDERTELIEGDIITLPLPEPRHRTVSLRLYNTLYATFGQDHYVMHGSPIVISEITEPLPDVVVASGPESNYDQRHPDYSEISLAAEVSDSSLRKDRTVKTVIYAGKVIVEYWIVNLVEKQVEVYTDPSAGGYTSTHVYKPGESIAPLFAPDISIAVSDFLV